MKQTTYDAILEILCRKTSFSDGLAALQKKFPNILDHVSEKTLRSIQSQYYVRRMRRGHHHHYSRETREKYYSLYEQAKSKGQENVIVRLAAVNDISPCLLARIILEEYYWNHVEHDGRKERADGRVSLPPGFMTDCIRNIAKLPNPHLAQEIYQTMLLDNFYGPVVDSVKKTCGIEYEVALKSYCSNAGLNFIDEDEMRDRGYDKTPDIRLNVPILINKKVVNWIESKASFGDPMNHQQYMIDQYLPYKNRFGSGAVIYWYGYVDELALNGERGIMLLDRFPNEDEIVHLKDSAEDTQEKLKEILLPEPEESSEEDTHDPFYNFVDPRFNFECET